MIRKTFSLVLVVLWTSAAAMAAALDGRSFEVQFQSEDTVDGTVDFKNNLIVSPIHQVIMDKEKELYRQEGAGGMRLATMHAPAGAPYSDQELDEGVQFSGRVEGFPALYWSGWVRGSEIEGTVMVESYLGGYSIAFKGTEK